MIDLLITNATLPDGRTGMDIACASGLVAEIAPGIKGEALKTIDARGYLVSPPFIDFALPYGCDSVAWHSAP